jgi:hypothetical protein
MILHDTVAAKVMPRLLTRPKAESWIASWELEILRPKQKNFNSKKPVARSQKNILNKNQEAKSFNNQN